MRRTVRTCDLYHARNRLRSVKFSDEQTLNFRAMETDARAPLRLAPKLDSKVAARIKSKSKGVKTVSLRCQHLS